MEKHYLHALRAEGASGGGKLENEDVRAAGFAALLLPSEKVDQELPGNEEIHYIRSNTNDCASPKDPQSEVYLDASESAGGGRLGANRWYGR
jgi:hypothetical protein